MVVTIVCFLYWYSYSSEVLFYTLFIMTKPRHTEGCFRADGGGGPFLAMTESPSSGVRLMVKSSGDSGELKKKRKKELS